jgi:hypothetical protein
MSFNQPKSEMNGPSLFFFMTWIMPQSFTDVLLEHILSVLKSIKKALLQFMLSCFKPLQQ